MFIIRVGIEAGCAEFIWIGSDGLSKEEGISIRFRFDEHRPERHLLTTIQLALEKSESTFLKQFGKMWKLDFDELRKIRPRSGSHMLEWATGVAIVYPEVNRYQDDGSWYLADNTTTIPNFQDHTHVYFDVHKEDFVMQQEIAENLETQQLFLSYKGSDSDKALVRRFSNILKELGFDPWLDEEEMPAGTELNRAILKGMKNSCAAIFFITPDFQDDRFLRTEIDYAIQEKQNRRNQFGIVTLLFGDVREPPDLLKPYVWKTLSHELEALNEILRAIPLEVGLPGWKKESLEKLK